MFWWGNLRERGHFQKLSVDKKIINVTRNIQARSYNHFCLGKSNKYYIFWVWVCSSRYPACNAHAPYCHLWSAPLYNIFPYFFINGTIFEEKECYCTQNVCLDFLYNFCPKHFSLYEELGEILLKMYIGLHVKYRLFFSECNETWIFSTDFRKTQIRNFMKFRPVGAELFNVDGQTDRHRDMTKLIVTFCNFLTAPKNVASRISLWSGLNPQLSGSW
jgi:hypothetical protein